MSQEFVAEISEPDASAVLSILTQESDLLVVSYGKLAVDLQRPDSPSPHAISLEASYADGRLRLVFHMQPAEVERRRKWLVEFARGRGIELALDVPST